MLVLSNDDIRSVIDMPECVDALEEAYLERFHDRALSRPRVDLYAPEQRAQRSYVFKSMEELLPKRKLAALRLNSDIIEWRETAHGVRKDKQPLADGMWVGLIALFDTDTGKMLALMPDGVIQGYRVGATSGIAIKYMAKADATKMGLFGTGWQAQTHALAASVVRPLERINVYSPTEENRNTFAQRMSERLGIAVVPVDTPEQAATGVDIVLCATNAITPVVRPEWIDPGTHLSCVKHLELGDELIGRSDVVAINTRLIGPDNYIIGRDEANIMGQDPLELGAHVPSPSGWERAPALHTIVGQSRLETRANDRQISCFINNIGIGLQFAAVGARIYEKASGKVFGTALPDSWFTEDVPP